ncbi:hypothetical protein HYZ78_03450 [Candidatus Microgenomates bacterium]|nr:hypothetical protein [Candidatus Microgenomates bacterium]
MKEKNIRLTKAYKRYRKSSVGKKVVLSFLRSFMPEMVLRTTQLEGERANRRAISSLFK